MVPFASECQPPLPDHFAPAKSSLPDNLHERPVYSGMGWSSFSQQQRGDGGPGWQKLWKAIAPPGAARHTSAGKMAMRLRARRVRCGCARWTYSTSSARTPVRLLLLLAALPLLLLLLLAVLMLLQAVVTAALLKHVFEHDPPDMPGER